MWLWKRRLEFLSCVFLCVCVYVCEWCWMAVAWIKLCLWVPTKMGNEHQLPLNFYFRLRASNLHPSALIYFILYNSNQIMLLSLWPVCFPVLVSAQCTVKGVWDHFRLLDVPLCYCASEITRPSIFRSLLSYQCFISFAHKSPEEIEEFISGTLVYVCLFICLFRRFLFLF